MATTAKTKKDVEQLSSSDRLWDSLNHTYGLQREEIGRNYDKAYSQADRQALSRGMQRSSYNAANLANINQQRNNALEQNYANQIADYENRLTQQEQQDLENERWEKQFNEGVRQFNENLAATREENEKNRAFQTAEREAQQGWQSSENALGRAFTTAEREAQQGWQSGENALSRAFTTAEREAQQAYQSGENAINRAYNTQEREAQQAWQTAENQQNRAYNTAEREAQQAYNTAERIAQQNYNSAENAANRAWQSEQTAAQQAWQSNENALNRDYNTAERIAQQIYNTSERVAQQGYNTAERIAQQNYQSGENALTRAENARQFNEQMGYNYAQADRSADQWERSFAQDNMTADQKLAASYVAAIAEQGGIPSDELLARAGLSRADAEAMRKGGSTSGSGGSGGTGGNPDGSNPPTTNPNDLFNDPTGGTETPGSTTPKLSKEELLSTLQTADKKLYEEMFGKSGEKPTSELANLSDDQKKRLQQAFEEYMENPNVVRDFSPSDKTSFYFTNDLTVPWTYAGPTDTTQTYGVSANTVDIANSPANRLTSRVRDTNIIDPNAKTAEERFGSSKKREKTYWEWDFD